MLQLTKTKHPSCRLYHELLFVQMNMSISKICQTCVKKQKIPRDFRLQSLSVAVLCADSLQLYRLVAFCFENLQNTLQKGLVRIIEVFLRKNLSH